MVTDDKEDELRGGSTPMEKGAAGLGREEHRRNKATVSLGFSLNNFAPLHGLCSKRFPLPSRNTSKRCVLRCSGQGDHIVLAARGFSTITADAVGCGNTVGSSGGQAREAACSRPRKPQFGRSIDKRLVGAVDLGFVDFISIDCGYEHGEEADIRKETKRSNSNSRTILRRRGSFGGCWKEAQAEEPDPLPRSTFAGDARASQVQAQSCAGSPQYEPSIPTTRCASGNYSSEIEQCSLGALGEDAGYAQRQPNRGSYDGEPRVIEDAFEASDHAPLPQSVSEKEVSNPRRHVNGGSKLKVGSPSTFVDDESAVQAFFGQLWEDDTAPLSRVPTTTPRSVLSWIQKDLVRRRAFMAEDCFQVPPREDHLTPTSEILLGEGEWNCCPRPTIRQILEVWNMADRGRAKSKGRGGGGGRGNQWIQPPQMPPPFDYFQPPLSPPGIPPQQQQFPFPQFGFPPWQSYPGQYQPPFQNQLPTQWQGNWQQHPQQLQQQSKDARNNQPKKVQQKNPEEAGTSTEVGKAVIVSGQEPVAVFPEKRKEETYAEVICYNCGEPGHHKAACTLPPSCFICGSAEHEVEVCPTKKEPQDLAKFIGSAASGLGFYHIELYDQLNVRNTTKNVGLIYIDAGSATKEDLYQGLATIYKTNWPWQIRELDEWTYLVKFPPHIKVEEVAGYPSFGLPKEGVYVKVNVWKGGLEYFADVEEVWLQLRGLDPTWCKWKTLVQFVTAFGIVQ